MTKAAKSRFLTHYPGSLSEYADELGIHHGTLSRWLMFINDAYDLGLGQGHQYIVSDVERRQLKAFLLLDQGKGGGRTHMPGYNQLRLNVAEAIRRNPTARWVLATQDSATCMDSLDGVSIPPYLVVIDLSVTPQPEL